MQYEHTQTAPLYLLLVVAGVVILVGGWSVPQVAVQVILFVSGTGMLILAACFRELTVRDTGEGLSIAFGPLPLFRRYLRYDDIQSVARARSTVLDGWGIHLSPSGGWIWNLWGLDCIDVRFNRGEKSKKLRIGTDDPIGLEAFLLERVSQRGRENGDGN